MDEQYMKIEKLLVKLKRETDIFISVTSDWTARAEIETELDYLIKDLARFARNQYGIGVRKSSKHKSQ